MLNYGGKILYYYGVNVCSEPHSLSYQFNHGGTIMLDCVDVCSYNLTILISEVVQRLS